MNLSRPNLANQSGPAWAQSVPALYSRDILSRARDYLLRSRTGMRACALFRVKPAKLRVSNKADLISPDLVKG